jgi:DNA polymerase III sliding clamp (beta) subunit (PCNA family)
MTQLKIKVQDFNQEVAKVMQGASADSELAAYSAIRINYAYGMLTLSGVSSGMFVQTQLEVGGNGFLFDVSVPAKTLSDITSSFSDGEYTLTKEEDSIKLACRRSRFTIKTFASLEMPELEELAVPFESYSKIEDLGRFVNNIKRVSKLAVNDPKIEYGKLIHITPNIFVVTTGVLFAVMANSDMKNVEGFHLYDTALDKLMKVVQDKSADLFYYESVGRVSFRYGTAFVSAVKVSMKYPNYNVLLDRPYPNGFEVLTSELKAAVKAMKLVDDKGTASLVLSVKPCNLTLSMDAKVGDAEIVIEDASIAMENAMRLQVALLAEGVSTFTSERIGVRINQPNEPIQFCEEGYRVYVAPIKF